ncbi:MAG: DEAD/DEAH box helicase family protein [Deltaproteobacteria bacterium]|nr:DEAD/DEAH box helicase family protein [Deltaproteobacteria bacterium]
MSKRSHEPEWRTRKERIDPRLDAKGWAKANPGVARIGASRVEELETDHGPADYALAIDGAVVGIVEAKKLTVGPQGVLTQAVRYARGLTTSRFDFDGCKVPFLYSTNGEVIWFHDIRNRLNRSRKVADFHTPDAMRELLGRDFDGDCEALLALAQTSTRLRPYQLAANAAVEKAIAERKRHMLVAMATGTGKTFTLVNQVYRLMKAGVARRVLFLVDRRALAAQAVRAFASFEAEPGQKFTQLYEVYSNRFQREDFGDDDKFDPKLIPQRYLEAPKPSDSFVYISTIQRVAINILGRDAVPGLPGSTDETLDEDAGKLDIPIHAFDVVIADECHRGYTSAEQSVWRSTLDHLDAIKIGLTATPAQHTTAYFQHKVFDYGYEQAVRDGYLVDYNVVTIKSDVRMKGVFLAEGEQVERVDPESGMTQLDLLEDERHFETTEIEAKVTAPDSNRKILEEVKKYALEHEQRFGRFPKTLIFAVNDVAHTSHADQLVDLARDAFGRGDAFVQKITGKVDRPLQAIREFRNRREPGVVVTVDLLSTGVDIPDLEFIVFLRPVKSRILFEQMLGRGTRKGEQHKDKSHFTVFDCFDGTLFAYFKNATGITAEPIERSSRTIVEIIEDVWSNRDRDYNIKCLVKRLHRIDKEMAAEGRELFAAHVPDGDLARYARGLPAALKAPFAERMGALRNPGFQNLLVSYPRPTRVFYVAHGAVDEVSSAWLVRDGNGVEYKPDDYLAAFERFVRDNPDHIEAIRVLLDRPKDWGTEPLTELRTKLAQAHQRFTIENLQRAHEVHYHKALVDLISMVKHAADETKPLLTAAERVERAFKKLTAGETFTPEQRAWLDRIREHLIQNLSIEPDDFDIVPVLEQAGGYGAAKRVFGKRLGGLLRDLNALIAA